MSRRRALSPYVPAPPPPLLSGPAFEPWERFMLLSRIVEEIPARHAADVLPHVTMTAMTVVRQVMGNKTRAEAYAAIEQTRQRLEEARRA